MSIKYDQTKIKSKTFDLQLGYYIIEFIAVEKCS